jgi:hypothetical protein
MGSKNMDEATIRDRIRTMIRTGQLPCDDTERLWGGQGDGKGCMGCLEPILPTDVEYEVDLSSGATIHLHRRCHTIWEKECADLPT